jgi:hypothetical protein
MSRFDSAKIPKGVTLSELLVPRAALLSAGKDGEKLYSKAKRKELAIEAENQAKAYVESLNVECESEVQEALDLALGEKRKKWQIRAVKDIVFNYDLSKNSNPVEIHLENSQKVFLTFNSS